MDTTEVYIKMCERATEIQDSVPIMDSIGLMFWKEGYPKQICYSCDKYIDSKYCPDCGKPTEIERQPHTFQVHRQINSFKGIWGTWLPRQDQLQEMIDTSHALWSAATLTRRFHEFVQLWVNGLASMEQLWFAFVMKEKYQKVWNGEDWV